jgi:hypothetical protein
MPEALSKSWRILGDWLRTARKNAQAIKGSRMIPAGLAGFVVLIDFALVHLCFRYTRELSIMGYAFSGVILYLVRLAITSVTHC